MWDTFGNERLFVPFSGGGHAVDTDWQCTNCGKKWYRKRIMKYHNAHCPVCGVWIGLKGLKFNGRQKGLEEF
jgi:DNA-directed RNA polymerase subunit RPC12/RpoP